MIARPFFSIRQKRNPFVMGVALFSYFSRGMGIESTGCLFCFLKPDYIRWQEIYSKRSGLGFLFFANTSF